MRRLAVLSLLVVLAVVVSAASRQVPQELSEDDMIRIHMLIDNWEGLLLANDLDGQLNLYTDTAVELFNNGGVNLSKANIRIRWQVYSNYEYSAVDFELLEIAGYGDTASVWTKETITYKTGPDSEPTTDTGVWLYLMKKVDGAWRVAVVSWTQAE